MIVAAAQSVVRRLDDAIARAYLPLAGERDGLLTFLFHSLFRDGREIARNDVDPLDRTTVSQFRRLIEYYLEHGYRFIRPDELLTGAGPRGKCALLTFDDGYYNNTLALPVLREFDAAALFFISTSHVRQNKCFWWDVLYRERRAQGASERDVYREAVALKSLRADELERRLVERFGPDAFKPRGDVDRPFTPHELRTFAGDPHVHLGNHTADHAILTNYPSHEAREQVAAAQRALAEMTGVTPTAIAYPNGGCDERVVKACREVGLKLGFTIRPEKTRLPLTNASSELLRLGRFVPHAGSPIERQCRTYRSDVLIYGTFRDIYLRLLRRQPAG